MTQVLEPPLLESDAAEEAAPPPSPLRKRAMHAAAWVVAGYPLSMVMQLARSMALTRLLYPEAFGLMTLVNVFLSGLQMCSDLGVSESIVQSPDGSRKEYLQTAWTVQVTRSCMIWVLASCVAWPMAVFYKQPMLLKLLPAAALTQLIMGFRSTSISVLRRNLALGRMMTFEYSVYVGQVVLIVATAWWMRSVWALVVGGWMGAMLYVVVSHIALRGVRHRFRWDPAAVKSLVHFGRWIFISTILTFLAQQLDRLMLGRLIPAASLGIYSTAMVLATLPRNIIGRLSNSVLFPVLSEKARSRGVDINRQVLRARSLLLLLSLVSLAGVAVCAPAFFQWLYDRRYAGAGQIAQMLVVPAWFILLQESSGYVLLSLGDSRRMAFSNAATSIANFVAASAGYYLGGLPMLQNHLGSLNGFIIGLGIGGLVGQLVTQWSLARRGVHLWGQDFGYTLIGLLLIPAGALAAHRIHLHWARVPALWGDGALMLVFFLPLALWALKRAWPELKRR